MKIIFIFSRSGMFRNDPECSGMFRVLSTPGSVGVFIRSITVNYFGGARSKGFAALRNVSKLTFLDKIEHAKTVGFRFYSAI